MASGVNRNRAAPVSSSTGTNTMQMASVETKAGTAICDAPSSTARTMRLAHGHIAVRVLHLHRRVVHQNADGQREAAQRHRVDRLAEQAQNDSEVRIDSGIEMQTISVLRQLPRNSRIIRPVSSAAVTPSLHHAVDGGAHEERLVEQRA